jgi:hypothetical protein
VTGRLINNITGKLVNIDEDETILLGIAVASSGSGKPSVQKVHVRKEGTFEVWLPPGKNSIYVSGGPFFAVGDVAQGVGHDAREIDVKAGQQYTIEFRVVRITPMKRRGA